MAKKNKKAARLPTPPPMDSLDDDLMDDLLAQLDSKDKTVQQETAKVLTEVSAASEPASGPKKDARSRFEARQARKIAKLTDSLPEDDPEVQARLQKEAQDEEDSIMNTCKQNSLQLHEVNADGHCLFSAVADQLALFGILPPDQAHFANVRATAADFIHSHPGDFLPFLPVDESGLNDGFMTKQQFDDYCTAMRSTGVWGGEPEIVALTRAYNVPIYVVQGGTPLIVKHGPDNDPKRPVLWISYHRRMYGLGEHYNSLRPAKP